MTELLDDIALASAWGNLENPPEEPVYEAPYRFYKPLSDAIGAFKRDAQATERIYTGIGAFDEQMRGISGGQLCVVQGHSHSGKTLVATHILRYNRNKRIAVWIPDEDAPLVLAKLAAVTTGVAAKELEERVAQDDAEALNLLRKVATEDFPHLAVFDGPVDANVMEQGFKECTRAWGAPPEMVMLDFLDQLQVGDSVMPKFDFVKAFGKKRNVPFVLLHQTSRAGGADGKKMTLTSGSYGGESHATYIIGVRRKKYALLAEQAEQQQKLDRDPMNEKAELRLSEIEHELKRSEYTATINLVKNKRVGGSLVDDIDVEIEMGTGRLTPLEPGEIPVQIRRTLSPDRTRGFRAPTWSQPSMEDF